MIKDLIAKVSTPANTQKAPVTKAEGGDNQEADKGLFGLMLQSVQSEGEGKNSELTDGEIAEGIEPAEEQTKENIPEIQGAVDPGLTTHSLRFTQTAEGEAETGDQNPGKQVPEVDTDNSGEVAQGIETQKVSVPEETAEMVLSGSARNPVVTDIERVSEKGSTESGVEGQVIDAQQISSIEKGVGVTLNEKSDKGTEIATEAEVNETKDPVTGTSGDRVIETAAAGTASVKSTEQKTAFQTSPSNEMKIPKERIEGDQKPTAHRTQDTAEKVVDVRAKSGVQSTEKEIQIQQIKAGEESKKERTDRAPLNDNESADGARPNPLNREGELRILQGMGNRFGLTGAQMYSEKQPDTAFTEEQEAILKELKTGSGDQIEVKEAERQAMNSMRLGEFTVQNTAIRRTVIPGITQTFSKATSEGKAVPENWQKHHFELGEGNKIELSTRQVDGVIQLKLASSSPELNRMLQEYSDEIKEHLEKELNINIDLQFDDHRGQESAFSGDHPSQGRGQHGLSMSRQGITEQAKTNTQNLQQTVRQFGYNQMEWTA